MLATIIYVQSWPSRLTRLVDHQTNVSESVSTMRIIVVQRRSAELLCIWVNIVSVMSKALQALVTVLTVKPAVHKDRPCRIDGVQNWRFGDDLGLVTRSPHDFLNASAVAS